MTQRATKGLSPVAKDPPNRSARSSPADAPYRSRSEWLKAAHLCESLVTALSGRVDVLVTSLVADPQSEPALTALADLALIASVLERHEMSHESAEHANALADRLRTVLASPACAVDEAMPGPAQWALHASRAWLDPKEERRRLQSGPMRRLVAASRREVLQLGPAWRQEEAAYVAARISEDPKRLPSLRSVAAADVLASITLESLYELTHISFYATDFGAVSVDPDQAAGTAKTARRYAAVLAGLDEGYDVGVELILAARYLLGEWPVEAEVWIETLMPHRAAATIEILSDRPEAFFSLYHMMAITSLALKQATAAGGHNA